METRCPRAGELTQFVDRSGVHTVYIFSASYRLETRAPMPQQAAVHAEQSATRALGSLYPLIHMREEF